MLILNLVTVRLFLNKFIYFVPNKFDILPIQFSKLY